MHAAGASRVRLSQRTWRLPRAKREATTSLKTTDTATTETPSTACCGCSTPDRMDATPRRPAKPSCAAAPLSVPVTGPLKARERTHESAHRISSGVGGSSGEADSSALPAMAVAAAATDAWWLDQSLRCMATADCSAGYLVSAS